MPKNIAFSLLSFASTIVLAFFVSPMILRNLGDTRFGVWALFGELLTYYGLLDFGIRGAVNNYVGRSLAQNDDSSVQRYVSSGFYGLTIVSAAAFVVSVSLVFLLRQSLVPDGLHSTEVITCACMFLAIFCIGLPLEIFAAILIGSRSAYLVSSLEIGARLFSTALMVAALTIAPNLFFLVGSQLMGRLLYWFGIFRKAHKHVPQATISFDAASFKDFKALLGFGSKNAWISVSTLVVNRKDVSFLTIFQGVQWVPTYSFARIAVQTVSQACSSITQSVRPNLVYHWARKEYDQAYNIYYTITRYSAFVVCMMAAFLIPFATSFLRLWVGERFVTGNWWFRTDVVLWLLLAGQLPRMMHSTSWQFLFALQRQNALTILITIEAVVNTMLSVVLVQWYGAAGLAIALLIPMLISHGIVLPIIMRHVAGVSLRRYYLEGVSRPIFGAICVGITGYFLQIWIPATTWRILLIEAAFLATLAAGFGAAFVARPDDRARALSVVSKIVSRGNTNRLKAA